MRKSCMKPLPEFTCHWMVGLGPPLAEAVNTAVPLALTDWLDGCVVTTGAAALATVSCTDAFAVE